MKGISPLIAAVLLIAFTVSVSLIISGWFTSLTRSTTENISNRSAQSIECSYGGINIRRPCKSGENITGIIENTGSVDLSNIGMEILYSNGSSRNYNYTQLGFSSNSLLVGNQQYFNVELGASLSDIILIRVKTNCPQVDDEIESSTITACT
ncbi:MAG: archaellin/type IV pilin N-terminal domain-containing protein [Candidatus Aenigmatarchaeota archaeon]